MSVELTPNGTHGATMPNIPRPLRKVVFGTLSTLIKLRGGNILVLTTTGAKSGIAHRNPLSYFPAGENAWFIVASAGGAAKNPGWYYNLARNPDKVWIDIEKRRLHVQPESLKGEVYTKAWTEIVAKAPGYGGYQTKTDRHIPIIRLTLIP